MTKYQDSFLSMTSSVCAVLSAYQSTWSTNAGFSAAANAFMDASKQQANELIGKQTTKSAGLTAGKQQERAALSADLAQMASAITLYALTTGNSQLRAGANLTPTRIKAASDDALVGIVTRITQLATEHLPALAAFGITAADVSALSAKSAAYAPMVGAPRRLRQTVAAATADLAALIKEMRTHLELMDAYVVVWRTSAPEFHSEYFTCRRVVRPGFRTRALELRVQDAEGAPVAGAMFKIPGERITKKTSERGVCRISHLPDGSHRAQVMAKGFAEKEITVQVLGKEGTKMNVVLERV